MNDTTVSMTFKNNVTGQAKLERYEQQLIRIKKAMLEVPNSVAMDTKPVDKVNDSLNKTDKTTNALNTNLNKTTKLFKSGFNAVNIIALGRTIKNAFTNTQKFIDASASYVENLNLMQVAFKETGTAADRFNESFVNGLADVFGLDESVMTRQLGFYRQIGNALNVDSKYADMLAKNLLKMQLDMSSLYNLSFSKSGEVLQSAIAGQTKPVRGATGADITQASLQTTLDDLGIDRAISDLSRGEKVLTIYLSLLNQISESQGDLAKTINSVANQEKILTEQTGRMTRMFGNVFSVTASKVLPYLNGFLMVINELIEKFAIFIGFKIPTYEIGGYEELENVLGGIEENAEGANKALSGLRKWDRLNVITTPKNTGVNGIGSGGIDKRLLDALTDYDLKMGNMQNKATIIRDRMMEWLGFTKKVNEETNEITWEYQSMEKQVDKIAKRLGKDLAIKFNHITDEINWNNIGEKLALGVNVSFGFMSSFIREYDWKNLGKDFAIFINKAVEDINWQDVGLVLFSKFKIAISFLSGSLQNLDYEELGEGVADFLNGALEAFPSKDLAKGFQAFGRGFLTALGQVLINLDWGELLTQLFTFMGNLGWEGYAVLLLPGALKLFTKAFALAFGNESVLSGITKLVFPDLAAKLNLGGAVSQVSNLSTTLTGIAQMGTIALGIAITVSCLGKIVSDSKQLNDLIDEATGTEQKEKRQQELEIMLSYIDEGVKSGDIYENFDSYLDTLKKKYHQLGVNAEGVYEQFEGVNGLYNSINGKTEEWRKKIDQINDEYRKTNEGMGNIINNTELNNEQANELYQILMDQKEELIHQKSELTEGSDKWKEVKQLVKDTNGLMDILEEKYDINSEKAEEQRNILDRFNEPIDNTIKKWKEFGSQIDKTKDNNLANFRNGLEKIGSANLSQGMENLKGTIDSAYSKVIDRLKPAFENLFRGIETRRTIQVDANVNEAEKKITGLFKGNGILGKIGSLFKIPKYADGGLPPVGQLFVANEKGPELIGHLGGQSFVANQKQIQSMMNSNINSNSSRRPQIFNIYLDDNNKLATYVLDKFQDMADADGKPITIGG